MSIRKAVYDLLNNTESKVYPLIAEQEVTDPYITFAMRTSPVRAQNEIAQTDVSLTLMIYGSTHTLCVTLADAMYAAMEGATGSLDSGNETLNICNWESETDEYIEGLDKILITQEYNLKFD